jgi:hypothetical protein
VLRVRSPTQGVSGRSAATSSPFAELRGAIDAMFSDVDGEVRDALRMTAGELAENVLKYGEPVEGVAGRIVVSRSPDGAEIRSVNVTTNAAHVARVFEILGRIAVAGDLRGPFESRMTQLLHQPCEEATALGLLRIEYEGLFELKGHHADAILTLAATRRIA